MISCHELIEFCLDYLDGELPHDEEVGFRRHLAQCSDCVSFFETYRKTPELSREALQRADPGFGARIGPHLPALAALVPPPRPPAGAPATCRSEYFLTWV